MSENEKNIELPFVKLLDAEGRDVYFVVTEIAAIVPLGFTPNPFADADAEVGVAGAAEADFKVAEADSGVDTPEEAADAIHGEQGAGEDLVPTSRIVLKQGAAAQVLGDPSDIIALLFKNADADTLD